MVAERKTETDLDCCMTENWENVAKKKLILDYQYNENAYTILRMATGWRYEIETEKNICMYIKSDSNGSWNRDAFCKNFLRMSVLRQSFIIHSFPLLLITILNSLSFVRVPVRSFDCHLRGTKYTARSCMCCASKITFHNT